MQNWPQGHVGDGDLPVLSWQHGGSLEESCLLLQSCAFLEEDNKSLGAGGRGPPAAALLWLALRAPCCEDGLKTTPKWGCVLKAQSEEGGNDGLLAALPRVCLGYWGGSISGLRNDPLGAMTELLCS